MDLKNMSTAIEDDLEWKPRRNWWPILISIVVVAGLAVAVWKIFFVTRVHPNRVVLLVAMQTRDGKWSGDSSSRYAEALKKKLKGLGFDVEVLERMIDPSAVEQQREAALDLGAALVVRGHLRVVGAMPLSGSTYTDYAIEVALSVIESDSGAAPQPVARAPWRFNIEQKSEREALAAVTDKAVESTITSVVTALVQTPTLKRLSDDPEKIKDDQVRRTAYKLKEAFSIAAFHREKLKQRQTEQDKCLRRDQQGEAAKAKKNRLTGCLDESFLVGATPSGDLVLMDEPHHVDVLLGKGSYTIREGHERLVLVNPGGAFKRVILEVYNIFSYPSMTPDGRWIAVALDNHEWSNSIHLVSLADGTAREVVKHGTHYFSTPVISPDGKRIIYWFRTCYRCPSSAEIINTEGSGRRTLVPSGSEFMSYPVWSPDSKFVYLGITPSPMEQASVWRIQVDSGKREALLGPASKPEESKEQDAATTGGPQPAGTGEQPATQPTVDGEQPATQPAAIDTTSSGFDRPQLSLDGRFVVVTEEGEEGVHIGRLDLTDGTYVRLQPLRARRYEVSPDGKLIAFQTSRMPDDNDPGRGDYEIGVMSIDGKDSKLLTLNTRTDNLIAWSPDSRRIYFHQRSRDPDGDHWTNRVYWVSPLP